MVRWYLLDFYSLLVLLVNLFLKKESIGFGDVKLGLILGGYLGVKLSILALYMSFAISAIIVFILLGSNLIDRKAKIPFWSLSSWRNSFGYIDNITKRN